MRTKRRLADEGGFTMVEVMIAMVILAVGLLSLEALGIGAARLNARAERQAQYLTHATTQMETAMRELRGTGRALTAGTAALVTLPDGALLRTTVDSADVVAGGPREEYRVRVTVVPPAAARGVGRPFALSDSLTLENTVYVR